MSDHGAHGCTSTEPGNEACREAFVTWSRTKDFSSERAVAEAVIAFRAGWNSAKHEEGKTK